MQGLQIAIAVNQYEHWILLDIFNLFEFLDHLHLLSYLQFLSFSDSNSLDLILLRYYE